MKVLVDMNLSPQWVEVLQRHGFECTHWIEVGDIHAKDVEITAWARDHGYVVFTHDLDFGAMLALTRSSGLVFFKLERKMSCLRALNW